MKKSTKQDYATRISRVLVHIQNSLDKDPDLDELASVAHFSRFHFHRIFKGMVGETVRDHVRRLRLERAAFYLRRDKDISVMQAALEAGYETPESFSRAFCRLFGSWPSDWRKTNENVWPLKADAKIHYQAGKTDNFRLTVNKGEKMEAKITRQPERKVAFVRHIGPYEECQPAWDKICSFAMPLGLIDSNTCFLGLSHDDIEITDPQKLRYDACITLNKDFEPKEGIGIQVILQGEYATTLHIGPFEKMKETYTDLVGKWIVAKGREIKPGPCVEIYLNDPQTTKPKDLRVEIQVPLEPKG